MSKLNISYNEEDDNSVRSFEMQQLVDSLVPKSCKCQENEGAKLEDFKIVKMIGRGAFGKVFLVKQ